MSIARLNQPSGDRNAALRQGAIAAVSAEVDIQLSRPRRDCHRMNCKPTAFQIGELTLIRCRDFSLRAQSNAPGPVICLAESNSASTGTERGMPFAIVISRRPGATVE
jgi:hypothetical protein